MSASGQPSAKFGMPTFGTNALSSFTTNQGMQGSGMSGNMGSNTFTPMANNSVFKLSQIAAAQSVPGAPPTGNVVFSGRLAADAQRILMRSESLPSRANIQVGTDGRTVVLRGNVADERERRMAENMMRLTPGVRDVRNELNIPAQNPGSTRIP
jgi:hypothetical protein